MEEILQLIWYKYSIIYKVLPISSGAGFLPSTVCVQQPEQKQRKKKQRLLRLGKEQPPIQRDFFEVTKNETETMSVEDGEEMMSSAKSSLVASCCYCLFFLYIVVAMFYIFISIYIYMQLYLQKKYHI